MIDPTPAPTMLQTLLAQLRLLADEALTIWTAGGWAMWPIAAVACVLFGLGVHINRRLRHTGFQSVPESIWRRWIDNPGARSGPIGALLDEITRGGTAHSVAVACDRLRAVASMPFERDLRMMKVCIGAAPLFGLLGTVTGMLTTFDALAAGSGGDKTMAMIAAGISEALITTETGLIVALPGVFFQYAINRRFERFKAFLAHVESVAAQVCHRREVERGDAAVRMLAIRQVARALQTQLFAAHGGRDRRHIIIEQ